MGSHVVGLRLAGSRSVRRFAGGRRDPPLVAVPDPEVLPAEPPQDAERRLAAAGRQLAVLSLVVVEAAWASAIVERVGAAPGAVDEVMVVQVLARGAAGGGAAPAGAGIDRVAVALRGVRAGLDRVSGEDEVLEERQEADPARNAAGALGKRPG